MSSVKSIQDVSSAIFADFLVDSAEKFHQFQNYANAYPKTKLSVVGMVKGKVVSEISASSPFFGAFNVINYRQPNFRHVLPNMDGPLQAKGQNHGILLLSILSGAHTPSFADLYTNKQVCQMKIITLHPSGGANVDGVSMFTTKNDETVKGSICKFHKDEYITTFMVKFTYHNLTAGYIDENGVFLGTKGAFQADYGKGYTGVQAAKVVSS